MPFCLASYLQAPLFRLPFFHVITTMKRFFRPSLRDDLPHVVMLLYYGMGGARRHTPNLTFKNFTYLTG